MGKKKRSRAAAAGGGGLSLGAVLAAICSWQANHSIVWAILHAFCSWVYVIWWAFTHG